MQAVVETVVQTGATAALKDLTAPGGTDYLHGIAYWLVQGDHCYIVQHARARTRALEEYFTWLLRDISQTVGGPVTLQAEFDVSHVGGDLGDVNSIELRGLAPETVADGPDSGLPVEVVERRRSLADRMAPFTKALDVLKAALGAVETDRLMRRVSDDAALQVMLNISYLAKSRKVNKTGMRDLGVALRNLEDGEVRVRAKDGTIRSNEARLHATVGGDALKLFTAALGTAFANAHAFLSLSGKGGYLETCRLLIEQCDHGGLLAAVGVTQAILGPAFLFLLLLTVRNRFRLA